MPRRIEPLGDEDFAESYVVSGFSRTVAEAWATITVRLKADTTYARATGRPSLFSDESAMP